MRRQRPSARYRIVLALEAAGGGAGRHVLDLAEGLALRNHNVCIVYSSERADESFLDALQELKSVSLHELPMQRAVGWHDVAQVRALRQLIRSLGPFDIAHGHSSKAGALLRLAARRLRLPCVYTPHAFITLDPEISRLKRLAYGGVERRLARISSRIICVSNCEYEHAISLGIDAGLLRVVHNGIGTLQPAERQLIRERYGLPPDAIVIGCVGRLAHQKAVERLLSAFAMGAAGLANVYVMVVGDGPDREMLEALASRQGLSSRILFTGAVDGVSAMAAFDIFALPSRYEALPYVLLEATARGLPIVMSDTGGAGSVVLDGVNGFVVPQRDTEAFSARLLQLCRESFQRERMGQRSIEVARNFTVDQMVMDTLEVYEECLPDSSDSRAD
jgi:glycosyltransferase involved in cell wall biosynthesis